MEKIDSSNDDSISENNLNVNIVLEKGQSFSIIEKTYTFKPSFIMVASGYISNKGHRHMDYTKELLAMTSQEAFVFNLLMDNRLIPDPLKAYQKSNHTFIDNSILTKSEKKKVYEGYKRLVKKDLVIRTQREKYLINPALVVTTDIYYSKEMAEYVSAKNKQCK